VARTYNSGEELCGGGGGKPHGLHDCYDGAKGEMRGSSEGGRGAEGVSERVGRRGHRAARCRHRWCMAATGQAASAAVRRGTRVRRQVRGERAGPASRCGPKGRSGPVKRTQLFLFIFQIQN
jgi:hypothetical protein